MFLRNLSFSFSGKAANTLVNVAFLAITARLYSKDEIAVLAVAAIFATLMDTAKGLGLATLLLKRLPKLDRESPEGGSLVLTFLGYSLLIPVVFAAGAAYLAPWISEHLLATPIYSNHLRLGLGVGICQALINSNMLVLQAREQFGWLAIQSTLSGILLRLAPALAALVGSLDFLTFLEVSLALAAVGCFISVLPLIPCLRLEGRRIIPLGEFWGETRFFYLTRLLRYGATQLDQLMVAMLFPPAVLAVYYMLRRLYAIAVVAIDSLVDTIVPEISRQAGADREAARRRLAHWLRTALGLGAIGGALLAADGRTLLRVVFGEGYAADNVLVTLFAVATVTYFVYGLAQVDLVLFHDPRRLLVQSCATAAANLVFAPALAWLLGIRGLPLSIAVNYVIGMELARRVGALSWRPLHLAGSLGLIAVTSIAAVWATAVESNFLPLLAVNAAVAVVALSMVQHERRTFSTLFGRFLP